MENRYFIKKQNVNKTIYFDGNYVGSGTFVEYVVYDKKTETPRARFSSEWLAKKWCIRHDEKGVYEY